MIQLAIPEEPTSLATVAQLRELERRVATSIQDLVSVEVAEEYRRRAEALEEYLRRREGHAYAQGIARRLEARIGELLGPAEEHKGGRGKTLPHAEGFPYSRRHEFRGLAEAVRRGLLRYEDDDPRWRRSRRALLRTFAEPEVSDGSPAEWQLYVCSCRELAERIDPESADVIITDPPYPREYLHTYTELSETAARILRPGGLVVALTGQSYLPEVLDRLAEYLTYHWTVAYLTPGGQSAQMWDRRVNTFWKPALVFRKGEYDGPWFGDVARSAPNDNAAGTLHKWGQSLSGMRDLVTRFSRPGDLVVDPFVGSGTIGVVATLTGRRFVGCDVDPSALAIARARLGGNATDV